MHPCHTRRLIAAAIAMGLLVALSTWLTRQYHQMNLECALIAAIKQCNVNQVDSLLAAGANPSTRDTSEKHRSAWQSLCDLLHPSTSAMSETALTTALTSDDPEDLRPETHRIVRALIHAGADVNAKTNNGSTAVIDCGYWGDEDIVEALIAAGADVNAKDNVGWTPLIVAAYHHRLGCVSALVAAGADVDAKDRDGNTALQDAKEGNYPDVAAVLRKAGARE